MIRIVVVDDSAVIRGLWTKLIDSRQEMKVVASANNGAAALDVLARCEADIVLLDLEMPEMDGMTALPLILKRYPGIRVIIASALTTQGSKMAVKALTLGASDYITKPSSVSMSGGVKKVEEELVEKINILGSRQNTKPTSIQGGVVKPELRKKFKAMVIGTSTGGPNALAVFLKNIRHPFGIPIFIVQHMPAYFISALAERISKETGHICQVATDGMKVEKNAVYIAPGDFHMVLEKNSADVVLKLNKNDFENFCRPAVDPLFRSAAQVYGPELLAVILTGMGEDGKRGSEDVRKSGGMILAQDESSSVVWGMPGAVARAGLASAVLPLESMSSYVEKLFEMSGYGNSN